MSEITIRSLYPEDLDRVLEIEKSLTGSSRRVFLEKRLAVATAMPDSFITCATIDNKTVVGYGFARILEGEFGTSSIIAVLDTVGVDPEFQGRGIGKMVLSGIERRMKKKNISTLLTQIIWSNHVMIKFFASAGFNLATGQIIERNTSPLNGDARPAGVLVVVRSLKGVDIAHIDRIDTRLTGLDRSAYYASKFREMLDGSGIRVSMVAESDGILSGFIMARVDYGEFGQVDKAAVIDTIGVHPDYTGSGVGHALLAELIMNLSSLQVESVRTKVEHENYGLRNFLSGCGFRPSQRLLITKTIG
ncbi:MAG: GNAT family N-acetyltransferase [Desulfuromonadales bacterium]